MALKESLDGVSSALSGILSQLKEIEATQSRISSGAVSYRKALSGVTAGGGVGSAPGVMDGSLGNVPPVGGGGAGGGGAPGVSPGNAAAASAGMGFAGKALMGVAAGLGIAADVAWNITPGVQDYMAYQGALFQTARYGAGGYDPNTARRLRANFGPYMTGNTDALAAAQIATMRGQGISSGVFDFQMRQSASISALTGLPNPVAAQAATSMYMGNTSGNLAKYGIFTNNMRTGAPKDLGQIVDELWARWFGSKNAKVDMVSLNAQLMGGFIGNDLQNLFGNDLALYQTIYQLILQKGQAGGKSVRLSQTSGPNSAVQVSQGYGNTAKNNPQLAMMDLYSTRFDTLSVTADSLGEGFREGVEWVKGLNLAMQHLATDMGQVSEMFQWLLKQKSKFETFAQTTEGSAIVGGGQDLFNLLGGVLGGFGLSRLLGGAGGGAGGGAAGGAARAMGGFGSLLGRGLAGVGVGALGDLGLQAGVNAFGKDANETGITWNNPAGLFKGFMNVLARTGIGAAEGFTVGGAPGAVVGSVLEGGYGIYQGLTDPLFGVKGHDNPTLIGGLLRSIFGYSKGSIGGTGSSTSDSINARLSRGEYVLNARAVQQIGVKNLDAMNALGQDFGSAFASPAKNFDKGGATTSEGWDVLTEGSPLLKSFSVPGAGSVTLRSDYGPMLVKVLQEYAADPVLSPVTYLSGYEYRQKYNPSTGGYGGGGWSVHAAGAAMDVDADDWGMPPGREASGSEIAAIRRILKDNPGIIWGGDWSGIDRDPMHWEVKYTGQPPTVGTTPTASSTRRTRGTQSGTGGVAAAPSLGILGGASLLSPAASSLGGTTGYVRGYSLPSLGSRSSLKASFTTSATIAGKLSSIASALAGSSIMGSSSGGSSTRRRGGGPQTPGSDFNFNEAATGSGASWLYQFLVDHGLRGEQLHIAWVLGMRESGGQPGNHSNGRDWGVFQINDSHLAMVKSMFGNDADMSVMLDPNKNFQFMMKLSNNFRNLYPWALEPDGRTFNWNVDYGGRDNYSYASETEANHASLWQQYAKYNKYNYSRGVDRTHESTVKVHEGEMILPALQAEEFRKVLRESFGGGHRMGGDINITLKIEKASDAEAERFAKRVKKLLEDDTHLSSMRRR